jgi:hypothetical protein
VEEGDDARNRMIPGPHDAIQGAQTKSATLTGGRSF